MADWAQVSDFLWDPRVRASIRGHFQRSAWCYFKEHQKFRAKLAHIWQSTIQADGMKGEKETEIDQNWVSLTNKEEERVRNGGPHKGWLLFWLDLIDPPMHWAAVGNHLLEGILKNVLWRYNSHATSFVDLNCTVQWFLNDIHRVGPPSAQSKLGIFLSPKKERNLVSIAVTCPYLSHLHSPPSPGQTLIYFLSL